MTDLKSAHLKIVQAILRKHLPGVEVRVFGSRVRGTAKAWSDLDLALVSENKLALTTLEELREDFAESDLPFRIDILDWHDISPEFKALIEAKYEVIQSAEPTETEK